MYLDAFYSFAIGFAGAILFVLVDKYEPDVPMARLLKFLLSFISMVAIFTDCDRTDLRCFSQRECGAFLPPSAPQVRSHRWRDRPRCVCTQSYSPLDMEFFGGHYPA